MKDNCSFVADLMNFNKQGPVAHVMVLQAIEQYTKHVANTPVVELAKRMEGGMHMIPAAMWHACAVEIQQKMKDRLDGKDTSTFQGRGPQLVDKD